MTPYRRSWHIRAIAHYSRRDHRYYCGVCPLPPGAMGVCAIRGETAHRIRCANCASPIVNHADPDVSVSKAPCA